jgi:hypothetical protein
MFGDVEALGSLLLDNELLVFVLVRPVCFCQSLPTHTSAMPVWKNGYTVGTAAGSKLCGLL